MPTETEEDIAKQVVAHFEHWGWDVYQEVQQHQYGRCADIVAVLRGKPDIIHVVEVKRSLTFAVIEQARWWLYCSHYSSVAVPHTKSRDRGRAIAHSVLQWQGIGLFETEHGVLARLRVQPVLQRKAKVQDWNLKEAQKTFAPAGNSDGRKWSPFQQTVLEIKAALEKNGPMSVTDVLKHCDHHYSCDATARSSLMKWARLGKLRGIGLDDTSRPYRFVIQEEV